jgi:outer membrane protein
MRRAHIIFILALWLAPTAASAQQAVEGPPRVGLDQAIRTALENNPSLREAASNLDVAELDRLNAVGDFLPTLSLGYGYSTSSTARLDPTQQSLTRTSYTLQLGASYELFDGGRRFSSLESARRGVSAEEASHRQARYQTVLDVKSAFYNAVANRDLVQVEEDRVARQEDQLEFVRQQLELGRSTRSDLLRSRVDLNNARLDLLNAENEARASTFRLAEAMGVDDRVLPAEEATLEVGELPYRRDELERIALQQGPTVESARASFSAAESNVSVAQSSYLPSLSFSGGWAWQNQDFPPENRSWSVSLRGNYPLFNGFDRETQVSQARARAEAAQARVEAAELQLRSNLDDAYSQVESALASVEIARQNVELSTDDLRVTRERYRLGLATILDLQSAQITLQEAEVELVRRRFDYQVGLARLEALLGRELEAR